MLTDVYKELAIDLLTVINLSIEDAQKVVKFLDDEGLIDYDVLKEYYLDINGDEE